MFSIGQAVVGLRSMVIAAAAVAGLASNASAGMTELRSTPHSTEQNQGQIFSHTYGGTFVPSGDGFSNGAITISRVNDLYDSDWTGKHISLDAVASFSRSEQSLGLLYGHTGGTYQSLFSVNQFGYLPSHSTSLDVGSNDYRFTLDNGGTHLRSSSLASENGTGDQLITYRVNGLRDGKSTYMLFWEDTPVAQSDHDYNDLVVKAQFSGPGGPSAVPLPPAAYMGLMMLAMLGGTVYMKRRKLRMV